MSQVSDRRNLISFVASRPWRKILYEGLVVWQKAQCSEVARAVGARTKLKFSDDKLPNYKTWEDAANANKRGALYAGRVVNNIINLRDDITTQVTSFHYGAVKCKKDVGNSVCI